MGMMTSNPPVIKAGTRSRRLWYNASERKHGKPLVAMPVDNRHEFSQQLDPRWIALELAARLSITDKSLLGDHPMFSLHTTLQEIVR